MAYENINKSYDAGIAVGEVVGYHERRLLKNYLNELTWGRDMQMRPLPAGNGRKVQFRRMVPFKPSTRPLEEGVTKKGQKLRMTDMWVTIKPYGEHIEFTDEFDIYHLDNLHREMNDLLGRQARESMDILARDAKCGGTVVQYAGGRANRSALTAADTLNYQEIRKAVRTLELNNAPKFSDGYYHATVDPYTKYDLISDPMWVDIAKYQDKARVEKNEIGIIAGVKFFESNVAKDYTAESILCYKNGVDNTGIVDPAYSGDAAVTVLNVASYDADTKMVYITEAVNEYMARSLGARLLSIGGVNTFVEYAQPGAAGAGYLKVRYAPANAATVWVAGADIAPEVAGPQGVDIRATVIYGPDFAGGVSLDGSGHNVRVILKPLGSSGSDDPYNQRGTIAYKIKGVGYHILQDAFGVRIEHAVSA